MAKFSAPDSLRDKVAAVLDECRALGSDSQDMANAALRAVDEWMVEERGSSRQPLPQETKGVPAPTVEELAAQEAAALADEEAKVKTGKAKAKIDPDAKPAA